MQFDLLAGELQLTIDGRAEPLLSATSATGFQGEEAPKDERTLPLPLPGVGHQLELQEPKWMKACGRKAWHLRLVHKTTGKMERVCWKCRSWRHRGDCARLVARRDFARIAQAFAGVEPGDLTYLVLTLDQKKDAARGVDEAEAYRTITRRWQSLVQWLRREFGPSGYVATVEQHRSGWPHLNVVVSSRGLAEAIKADGREDGIAPGWLKGAAVRCGFGYRAWAEAPRGTRELAGYLVKLAHKESLTGEVAKLSQLPMASPPGTRRLRSSRRFLPRSTNSSGEWAGELLKHSIEVAERLDQDAEDYRRRAEEEMQEEARLYWEQHFGLRAPQLDPEGAEGAAKPAGEEGGAAGVWGRSPRVLTTGTSHTTGSEKAGATPLPEALAGADPPLAWGLHSIAS